MKQFNKAIVSLLQRVIHKAYQQKLPTMDPYGLFGLNNKTICIVLAHLYICTARINRSHFQSEGPH